VKHEPPIDLGKLRSGLNSVVAPWLAELVAGVLRKGRRIVFGEIHAQGEPAAHQASSVLRTAVFAWAASRRRMPLPPAH
jgi:hypothetical protein